MVALRKTRENETKFYSSIPEEIWWNCHLNLWGEGKNRESCYHCTPITEYQTIIGSLSIVQMGWLLSQWELTVEFESCFSHRSTKSRSIENEPDIKFDSSFRIWENGKAKLTKRLNFRFCGVLLVTCADNVWRKNLKLEIFFLF